MADNNSDESSEKEADAQENVNACEERVDDASRDCENAKENLDQANAELAEAQDTVNNLEQWLQRVKAMKEDMAARHQAIAELENLAETAEQRLLQANEALERYLDATPSAREAHDWLSYTPEPGRLITPAELDRRLNPSPGALMEIARYMRDTDPGVRRNVDSLAEKLHCARAPMDYAKATRQISITLSGRLAEELSARALGCYGGSVSTQTRKDLDNGRYTKVDLVVNNLKAPVVLGKGKGMSAPAGGSLALEVKCGRKEYLRQQLDHMCTQARGHGEFNASFTLCSRDIHNLHPDTERQMRDSLRQAGSPLVGQLPYKSQMDDICTRLVMERTKALYENAR